MKRLRAEFPNEQWPLTTVKRLQRKIDDTGTVNRQINLFEQKMQYNLLLILCVKYLRLKVVIDKSCRGPLFSGHI